MNPHKDGSDMKGNDNEKIINVSSHKRTSSTLSSKEKEKYEEKRNMRQKNGRNMKPKIWLG